MDYLDIYSQLSVCRVSEFSDKNKLGNDRQCD
jgi:hypothetical protein